MSTTLNIAGKDMKFEDDTAQTVIDIIARYMGDHAHRLRFIYGDTDTGKPWGEPEDNYYGAKDEGYVSRSTGRTPIPIIVFNARAIGGSAISTGCVVKIEHCNKRLGGVLYDITPVQEGRVPDPELQRAVDYSLSVTHNGVRKAWDQATSKVILSADGMVGVTSNGLTLWYWRNRPGPGSRIYRNAGVEQRA